MKFFFFLFHSNGQVEKDRCGILLHHHPHLHHHHHLLAPQGQMDPWDPRDLKDQTDQKGLQGPRGYQDHRGYQDIPEIPRDLQADQGLLDLPDQPVAKDPLETWEQLALLVEQAELDSTWENEREN